MCGDGKRSPEAQMRDGNRAAAAADHRARLRRIPKNPQRDDSPDPSSDTRITQTINAENRGNIPENRMVFVY